MPEIRSDTFAAMNILRTILETPIGTQLVDAEHDGKTIGAMRIHSVINGLVSPPLDQTGMNGLEELRNVLQAVIR